MQEVREKVIEMASKCALLAFVIVTVLGANIRDLCLKSYQNTFLSSI
mgnify:CR=1 FL=1